MPHSSRPTHSLKMLRSLASSLIGIPALVAFPRCMHFPFAVCLNALQCKDARGSV
ncbi:hypothetical protein CGRA01v4_06718 [Colletotrichum graminicola]|nr:hypothetical protein CGRA01v4_06718 [Colletotrichum graminicola]